MVDIRVPNSWEVYGGITSNLKIAQFMQKGLSQKFPLLPRNVLDSKSFGRYGTIISLKKSNLPEN